MRKKKKEHKSPTRLMKTVRKKKTRLMKTCVGQGCHDKEHKHIDRHGNFYKI